MSDNHADLIVLGAGPGGYPRCRTWPRRSSLALPRVLRGDFRIPAPISELVAGLAQVGVALERRP